MSDLLDCNYILQYRSKWYFAKSIIILTIENGLIKLGVLYYLLLDSYLVMS